MPNYYVLLKVVPYFTLLMYVEWVGGYMVRWMDRWMGL